LMAVSAFPPDIFFVLAVKQTRTDEKKRQP